jgi:hypothetical protein
MTKILNQKEKEYLNKKRIARDFYKKCKTSVKAQEVYSSIMEMQWTPGEKQN